jgi:serine/threonine protein kinase
MNTIGKYKIRGLLGRGGMGKVYKVELPVIRKIAALKLLSPNPHLVHLMGENAIRDLFISEAVTMSNLRHPHIVEVWNFDETKDGKLFYAMDYYFNNLGIMIGESYITEASSRIIKLDKAIKYTRQILLGLSCLHHFDIVHRDIKPFNILVTDLDTIKICDFGLSKLRGEDFKGPENLKVGSPWYAAPEQEAKPDKVDRRADIYSVGIMLYRMLTGELPAENYEKPSKINADLDHTWDAFIARAIATEPRNRFGDANQMIKELDHLDNAWKEKKENICKIAPESVDVKKHPCTSINLRSHAVKVNPQRGRDVFSVNQLWQPTCYIENNFQKPANGTVTDKATGLIWQRSGSEYPLTWPQAHEYIEKLKQNHFAGYYHWRLPTIEELMSLLTPTPHGEDFCMEPMFDSRQKWLWSCDKRSYMAAWYVSADMGFVSWQDFSAYYYVRGVCGDIPFDADF